MASTARLETVHLEFARRGQRTVCAVTIPEVSDAVGRPWIVASSSARTTEVRWQDTTDDGLDIASLITSLLVRAVDSQARCREGTGPACPGLSPSASISSIVRLKASTE